MDIKKQAWYSRDFMLVVIGQIISLFGNAILRFALPLYLLRETGSPAIFGAVNASSFIPMILFSLVGGVLADRVNKRNIMVALDFSTAALIFIFYLLHGMVPIVPLMIVCLMILYGISGAYQPTVQASIPVLVERERMVQGNAIINMVNTLSSLLGPVIGGVLFGAFGIVPILFISIFCFVFSAVMEIFIHIPYLKQPTEAGAFAIVREDIRQSWRYIRHEKPVFLSVVLILALFNLFLSAVIIVGIPVIVVNILAMNDTALGIAQGALGLGGLMGGILAGVLGSRLALRHGYVLLVICAALSAFMALALLPSMPRIAGYALITVMSFLAMAVATLFTVQMCAAVQKQTPVHLIGKIMAFIMAIANCASPLGQALYGVLFDALSSCSWVVMLGAAVISLLIGLCAKKTFLRLEQQEQSQ